MIAAVVTAWATVPCRSFCRVVNGWSQGSVPPATAASARAGHATVKTPKAQADRAAHFLDETFTLFNRFIS